MEEHRERFVGANYSASANRAERALRLTDCLVFQLAPCNRRDYQIAQRARDQADLLRK